MASITPEAARLACVEMTLIDALMKDRPDAAMEASLVMRSVMNGHRGLLDGVDASEHLSVLADRLMSEGRQVGEWLAAWGTIRTCTDEPKWVWAAAEYAGTVKQLWRWPDREYAGHRGDGGETIVVDYLETCIETLARPQPTLWLLDMGWYRALCTWTRARLENAADRTPEQGMVRHLTLRPFRTFPVPREHVLRGM